jgi:hypothetical protein
MMHSGPPEETDCPQNSHLIVVDRIIPLNKRFIDVSDVVKMKRFLSITSTCLAWQKSDPDRRHGQIRLSCVLA